MTRLPPLVVRVLSEPLAFCLLLMIALTAFSLAAVNVSARLKAPRAGSGGGTDHGSPLFKFSVITDIQYARRYAFTLPCI